MQLCCFGGFALHIRISLWTVWKRVISKKINVFAMYLYIYFLYIYIYGIFVARFDVEIHSIISSFLANLSILYKKSIVICIILDM